MVSGLPRPRHDAVLVIAWLIYVVDIPALAAPAATWRRVAVALLCAAGVAMLSWAAASWARYARSVSARYLGLASVSDLPRSAAQVRELVRQEATARYGPDVWPHMVRQRQAVRTMLTAICGFLLAYFIYANFSRASGPPLIATVVLFAACLLTTRIARREIELSLQAMERAMGGRPQGPAASEP